MQVTDRMIKLAQDADWKVGALSRDAIESALSAVLNDKEVRMEIFCAVAAGQDEPAVPGDLTEEPPVGSRVIDCDGLVWIRGDCGWGILRKGGSNSWSTVREYAPLNLLREP